MYKKDLKTKYYILKDGKVLARVWTHNTAVKISFVHSTAYCCIHEHLLDIPDEWLYQMYQDYVGELPPPPMHVEGMAKELFAALNKAKHPYWKKPSAIVLLREMFEWQPRFTKDEIQAVITDVKWDSITVAMSTLRGQGVDVRHTGDGIYVRQ